MGGFIFCRKIYIAVIPLILMSFVNKIYDLLNNFSTEHFQDSTEAIINLEDFDTLMRKIGELLSCEKG